MLLSEIIVIVGIAVVLGHSTSRPIRAAVLRRAIIRVVIIRKDNLSLLDCAATAWCTSWPAARFCWGQVSGVVPRRMTWPSRESWWARLCWVSVIGTVLPIDGIGRARRCLLWRGVDRRVGFFLFGILGCCISTLWLLLLDGRHVKLLSVWHDSVLMVTVRNTTVYISGNADVLPLPAWKLKTSRLDLTYSITPPPFLWDEWSWRKLSVTW